jgi:hypothetical protein
LQHAFIVIIGTFAQPFAAAPSKDQSLHTVSPKSTITAVQTLSVKKHKVVSDPLDQKRDPLLGRHFGLPS